MVHGAPNLAHYESLRDHLAARKNQKIAETLSDSITGRCCAAAAPRVHIVVRKWLDSRVPVIQTYGSPELIMVSFPDRCAGKPMRSAGLPLAAGKT